MLKRALLLLSLLLPALPSSAEVRNLLEVRSFYTPTVAFSQKYNETAVNDPDFGPTPVSAGTYTVKITASLKGIDLSVIDSSFQVGFTLGALADSHALSEDPGWKPSLRTATFVLPGQPTDPNDPDSPLTVAGTITYTWTDTLLTITATGASLDAGIIVDPTAYDDGAIADTVSAEITFGDNAGNHEVNVTGTKRTTVKRFGSGDDAIEVPLITANIAGSADFSGPQLKLLAPAATLNTGTQSLLVQISSDGDTVLYSLNGEDFQPLAADPQTGNYLTTLTLQPGANHLEVLAQDESGNQSAAGSDIFYTVPTTLTVAVAGQGTVTPATLLGQTSHPIGETLTVTAKAASGQIFTGWTGDIESTEPTLNFAVTEAMSLTANFEPTPFTTTSGTYSASYGDPEETEAPAGALHVTVTTDGAFTGQVMVSGYTYTFTGQLGADGTASVLVPTDATHPDLVVQITVDPTSPDSPVSGTVGYAGSDAVADFTASPPASASNPLPPAIVGSYTLVLQATDAAGATVPSTAGYAYLRVTAAGRAVLVGKLNDGTAMVPISVAASVDADATLRLYAPLYAKSKTRFGALSGDLHFTQGDGQQTVCQGTLSWHVEALSKRLGGGTQSNVVIQTGLDVTGALYVAPTRTAPGRAFLATLDVTSESGDFSLSKSLRLSATGIGVVRNPAGDRTVFRINPRTGIFIGSFYNRALRANIAFSGVASQATGLGEGTYVFARYVKASKSFQIDYGTVTLTPTLQ